MTSSHKEALGIKLAVRNVRPLSGKWKLLSALLLSAGVDCCP